MYVSMQYHIETKYCFLTCSSVDIVSLFFDPILTDYDGVGQVLIYSLPLFLLIRACRALAINGMLLRYFIKLLRYYHSHSPLKKVAISSSPRTAVTAMLSLSHK